MSGYPITLTGLERCRCVVIGGGVVAARKVLALLEAGARPVVISPELVAELGEMAAAGQVETVRRSYCDGDLTGATVVVAATDEHPVNVAVSEEARQRGVLVNVVDDPELCTFNVPAVIRRGDLLVTISTGGGSPALAGHLRELLGGIIDPAYGDLLAILSRLRARVRREVAPAGQPAAWQRLLDGELLACLRGQGVEAAQKRAETIVDRLAEV